MSVIIRLQNLPWSATSVDIRQFFKGLSIPEGGVHIVGGDFGDSFIAFSSDEDARQAMQLSGGLLKSQAVNLLLSSRVEMQKVIEMARNPQPMVTVPGKPAPIKPVSKDVDPRDSDGRDRNRTHSRDRDRLSKERESDRLLRERDRDRSSKERDRDRDRYSSKSRRERSRSRSRSSRERRDTDRRDPDRRDRRTDRSKKDEDKRHSPDSRRDNRKPERKIEATGNDSNFSTIDNWPVQSNQDWPPKDMDSNSFNNMGSVSNNMNVNNANNRWSDNRQNFRDPQDQPYDNFSNNSFQSFGTMPPQHSNHMEPMLTDQPSFYVEIRGFPLMANSIDVRDFFQGLYVSNDGVVFTAPQNSSHGRTGATIYVKFTSANDHGEALKRHNRSYGGALIEVYVAKESDFVNAGGVVSNMNSMSVKEESAVVLMKGLPYQCQNVNISNFFRDLQIVNIVMVYDRNACFVGDAFVEFDSPVDAKTALTYSMRNMGPCTVDILTSSKEQMMEAATKAASKTETDFPTFPVLMQGLPFNASDRDIIEFFTADGGTSPVVVHVLLTGNGMATGEAFVEFNGQQPAQQALMKNNRYMGLRPVSVKPLSKNEMHEVLSSTRHLSSNFPHPKSNDQVVNNNPNEEQYPMDSGNRLDTPRNANDGQFGRGLASLSSQITQEASGRMGNQDMPQHLGSQNFNSMANNQQKDTRNRLDFGNRNNNANMPANNRGMGLMGDYPDSRKFSTTRWGGSPQNDDTNDFNEMDNQRPSQNNWQDNRNVPDIRNLTGNSNSSSSRHTSRWNEPSLNYNVPERNYPEKGGLLSSPIKNDELREPHNMEMGIGRWPLNQTEPRPEMMSGRSNINMMGNIEPEVRQEMMNKRHGPSKDMQDKRSGTRHEMMSTKRLEPKQDIKKLEPRQEVPNKIPELRHGVVQDKRQDVVQNKRSEPRQDVGQTKRSEPRQDVGINKRSEPRQDVGINKRSEPRQDAGINKRSEPRQDAGINKRSEPRQDAGINKRSEPRQDAGINKRSEPRQDAGINKRSEPRQDVGQNKRPEPRNENMKNSRTDTRQESEKIVRPEPRQEVMQNKRSEPRQVAVINKRPEPREVAVINKRPEPREVTVINKRPEPREVAVINKRPEPREVVVQNKRPEPRQNVVPENLQNNRFEPRQQMVENRRSDSRKEMMTSEIPDLRSEIVQNKRSDSRQGMMSNNRTDLRQEIQQNKRPDLRQEIMQKNPETWLDDNFGSFSNNEMDEEFSDRRQGMLQPSDNNRRGPGRMGLMNNPNSNRMGGRDRLDFNEGPMRRNGPPGNGMPFNNPGMQSRNRPHNQMQMNNRDGGRPVNQRNMDDERPPENQRAMKRPLMPNPPDDFPRKNYLMSGDRRNSILGDKPRMQNAPTDDVLQPASVDKFGNPGCVVGASNVPFRAGVLEILDFFGGFGIRKENVIRRFNENGMATGDARISFKTPQDAMTAMKELNQKPINGRPISLFLL